MMIEGPPWDEPTLLIDEEPPGAFPDELLDLILATRTDDRGDIERRLES